MGVKGNRNSEFLHVQDLPPEVFDVIAFTPRKISSWIRQGYDDAIRCVEPHLSLLRGNAE